MLESASLLSNKWLFFNLLHILAHSIVGTLLYAASLGFTIYWLSKGNILDFDAAQTSLSIPRSNILRANLTLEMADLGSGGWLEQSTSSTFDKDYFNARSSMEPKNLTLADCLVLGTILSSVDSTTLLSTFRFFQVNDRLYYLVLGENLMNNAVVLVIFDSLLDFFNATRLTVVKIYVAVIQFFVTLIGSIFIGLVFASIALIFVRLTKKFQVSSDLTSYQNQCQAMVETLLILKLAYLTYTLASFAGTSSIISLATFGILQDQYIKHNLNLRSQVTFKQVILASRTLGYSLVYPLIGMFLVEVANTSQSTKAWFAVEPAASFGAQNRQNFENVLKNDDITASKFANLGDQTSLHWDFRFLSLVTLITVVYRFIVVFLVSLLCNLLSSSRSRTKLKEQALFAYGGLKGPLVFAMVHRLIEHEEYRDRTMRSKHLFMYTILFITFVSTILKGPFIRHLVAKLQLISGKAAPNSATNSTIVFDEINNKLVEYLTHGLNNILGQSKSPCERFAELNEVHIKPWLARSGSNTNWLVIFYDNLILDETLNENCFYKSSSEPRLRQDPSHRLGRRLSEVSRLKLNFLDTIDETDCPIGANGSHATKMSLLPRGRNINRLRDPEKLTQRGRRKLEAKLARGEPDKSILKEHVMLDLKLEDLKCRRNSATVSIRPSSDRSEYSSGGTRDFMPVSQRKPERMLSTTSSEGFETMFDVNRYENQRRRARLDLQMNRGHNLKPTEVPFTSNIGKEPRTLLSQRRATRRRHLKNPNWLENAKSSRLDT